MTQATGAKATIRDIEMRAEGLDIARAAAVYREHGALVVRGLMRSYVPELLPQIEAAARQAVELLPRAQKIREGWLTPDSTLFIPAPPNFARDKQIMVLGFNYRNSSAFFRSAQDPKVLDLVEAVLGPDIELFIDGQCLYKEPCGGHPKLLHQDAAYFEHKFEGPMAMLCYAVDTDLRNGALHVIPGSHKWGVLRHEDTFSHLGLNPREWTFDKAVPVIGGPGDAIFFHVKTVHGSPENHSDKPRPVFIHRYRAADDFTVIGATTTESRALAEQRVAEAKKDNQFGLMVRGYRKWSAERQANS